MSEKAPMTFEETMARLEQIVADLEGGKQTLEQSIKSFEEGIALGKQCREFLNQADLRVRQLLEAADGTFAEGDGPDDER